MTINGQRFYLWRAVDSQGMLLDILVQKRRNAEAAKCFFEAVRGKTGSQSRMVVTDRLRSYNVIMRDLLPGVIANDWINAVTPGHSSSHN